MTGGLTPLYCANPACRRARTGRPRMLARYRPVPGAAFEPDRCKSCGYWTRVTVSTTGELLVSVQPPPLRPAA